MRLTKDDLNKIPAKTPGLMTRLCNDPFVRLITDGKPHTFFRRHPHMRNHSVAIIIDKLLKGGRGCLC